LMMELKWPRRRLGVEMCRISRSVPKLILKMYRPQVKVKKGKVHPRTGHEGPEME